MSTPKNPYIYFSVGEPSGDLHAAKLIKYLRSQVQNLTVAGLGGYQMSAAGCRIDYPLTDLAVVGFVEVIPRLREFFRVAHLAADSMDERRPDAVVLVDFPGFNWHIAKRAKQRGIPVYYYLPPQLWAWGSWRIHKMRRYVDHVLCNLPFEQEWFQRHGAAATQVGHPFFDEVAERVLDQQMIQQWSQQNGTLVAVLPGSRTREVQNIWPMQLAAIRQLATAHPQAHFFVACLKDAHCLWCRQQLSSADRRLNIHFFVNRTSEVISLADCGLVKSGSVSLELMARQVPTVIVYHVGRIMYQIARRLTDIDTISLPNMLAGQKVMQEFLAIGSTSRAVDPIVAAMNRLMSDPLELARQKAELKELSLLHAQPGASKRAAQVICDQLGWNNSGQMLRQAG